MKGIDLWKRVFNTDLEEAVLENLNLQKKFVDDGTPEENKEIVDALDGHSLADVVDWYFSYNGNGISSSDIIDLFDMLQIENVKELEVEE
jgi:hypothetical protein